ncbi:MAG: type II toxin-antitoxin system RelE/ParE family toxin [Caulobacteraceae bacterium]|nr:type II toxin-antitoxin system RelE/ParE family toxin [Caulobacteraceae bacterium]
MAKLGATASDIESMELAIVRQPGAGDVIPGGAGLRKVRFPYARQGKRGGGRTIYYLVQGEMLLLITAYAKADRGDVTADEMRLFRALVKELIDDQEDETGP